MAVLHVFLGRVGCCNIALFERESATFARRVLLLYIFVSAWNIVINLRAFLGILFRDGYRGRASLFEMVDQRIEIERLK